MRYRQHLFVAIIFIRLCVPSPCQELTWQERLAQPEPPVLLNAKVPKAEDAIHIALGAYLKKMRFGISAYDSPSRPLVFELGYDLNGFGNIGNKIWEIRFAEMNQSTGYRALRAVIWVNSNSGDVSCISGAWDAELLNQDTPATHPLLRREDKPTTRPLAKVVGKSASHTLRIEGVKVANQSDAKKIAMKCYNEKMGAERLLNAGSLSNDDAKEISVSTLGYGVADFSNKGERVWEVRIMTNDNRLRALLWINPYNEKVHFIAGPWKKDSSKNS